MPFTVHLPACALTIGHIIRMRTEIEMLGIDTGTHMATVQNLLPTNQSTIELPRRGVCRTTLFSGAPTKGAVT
jgi:hypothetical protein